MKVIVCAAGNSRRMGEATSNVPKSLLPVGETSLIENLIDQLSKSVIEEIIIVVGYLGHLIEKKVGKEHNGVPVRYVENTAYADTNNMYSILLARDHIDGPMAFISADVLLSSRICREFIQDGYEDMLLIDNDPKYFGDDDPVKVRIIENVIRAIDKKLIEEVTIGVACGLYKLSAETAEVYFDYSQKLIDQGEMQYGYIEPLKLMLHKHNFKPFLVKDKLWCDIDTPDEYANAKELFRRME